MTHVGRVIRVLVVEDSPTARLVLVETLSNAPGFVVIGEADNGADAVAMARRLTPDLITMDVQMPIMDGLDATRQIMDETPTPIVIVSNTISPSDVSAALTATRAGALTVLPKPGDPTSPDFEQRCHEFIGMARAMAGVRVVRRWVGAAPPPTQLRKSVSLSADGKRVAVRAIAIGTSTGGPAALHRIIEDLPLRPSVPVLVVQHMAHGFMTGLAAWLCDNTKRNVVVADRGMPLTPGTIYIAPDDQHLGVSGTHVALSDATPTNGFRPSADHLFHSCAIAYGSGLVGVILTGMGQDGLAGLRRAHSVGARVIAQDEASSAVYGMARAAVEAAVVDEVLPLDQIGRRLTELLPPAVAP